MSYNSTSCPAHTGFFIASVRERPKSLETHRNGRQREISFCDGPLLAATSRNSLSLSCSHSHALSRYFIEFQAGSAARSRLQWSAAQRSKKGPRPSILLASKTDNQGVSVGTQISYRSAEPPDSEPYAYFVQHREQIAAWLGAGYSVKGVWKAFQRAEPPFGASYQTFWRYCRQHGLCVRRPAPPPASTKNVPAGGGPPRPSRVPGAPPTVWPRMSGKPREFVPRTED